VSPDAARAALDDLRATLCVGDDVEAGAERLLERIAQREDADLLRAALVRVGARLVASGFHVV
jgi:hypothetical protein